MKNNKKKGFTLVELLVVIAIIAILATVSVVGYLGFTEKAKESKCLSEATQARDTIVAALVDGEETDESGAKKFTLANDTLTGNEADIKAVFGLTDLNGEFKLTNATKTFTYTVDGYTATFKLDGSNVDVAKATLNK